ncbi:MAG: hypothetical protein H0X17_10780 [Deltaproteobacteria bacterium]|nr:hypothetical protein [Deltaproteobacteria bacterium]
MRSAGRLVILVHVVLLAAVSLAEAEVRLDLHVVGGIEGGVITGEPRPDAVAEAGLAAGMLLPGRNWGLGVALDAVGRHTERFGASEELKLDVLVRFASRDRRFHWALGAGVRELAIARERGPASRLGGVDLFRLMFDVQLARSAPARGFGGAVVSLDLHAGWTFGCYAGELVLPPVGDMVPPRRTIDCVDTITTAYVAGLQTSVRWQ